ncbi:META domain-containing protein [Rhodocytophaga rosea]|uniref:META domain-containing protein n=1 Tax=Rhodocytophaga rosea TaxID=2704465 RepID=A0A6C0GP60_9BACT|nr:META domain-containing protein [Rhodocytophaga rosea]QHT69717.1 META domain-containing protein [Rhodocytophaga rosea]
MGTGGLVIPDRSDVDFVASGEKPQWTLEIDFSNLIHFYSAQTGSVYMPVTVPVKDESNGKVTYVTSSGSEKIQITMQAVACSSHGAENGFTYKVEVTYKNNTYTGCGHYLFPAERLHDIWVLEALNERKVSATAFLKGIPTLEIFVLEQKGLGTTGCNSFGGQVMIEKEKIRFLQLVATEMACAGSLEKEFLQALDKTNVYQLDSGKLILLKDKSEVLRFKKVD